MTICVYANILSIGILVRYVGLIFIIILISDIYFLCCICCLDSFLSSIEYWFSL